MTVGYCTVGLFVIISPINRSKFYCSSTVITKESFKNSTIFCKVAGTMFHYFLFNMTLWWFVHLCSIFYKVMFPLKAQQYKKKEKYVHILLFIECVFIPVLGVSLAYSVPDWGYVDGDFLCVPQNANLWYYSVTLSLNILLATGVSLFILMFWKLHKHQGIFCVRNKGSFRISTAERKILFVLCYYVILGVVMLLYHGLYTADQDLLLDALETYLHCQALGHPPKQTSQYDPKEYQQYIHPELAATTYLLMGFTTTANLAFVIN